MTFDQSYMLWVAESRPPSRPEWLAEFRRRRAADLAKARLTLINGGADA